MLVGGAIGYFAGGSAPPAVRVAGTSAPGVLSARGQSRAENQPALQFIAIEPGAAPVGSDAEFVTQILSATRVPDYFRRRHDIYEVGQRLDRDTIRASMDAVMGLKDSDRDLAQFPLLARWLELDTGAAYEWVNALPNEKRRAELTREFFHSLALKEPAAAMRYLAQHETGAHRGKDLSYSVIEAWSSRDPAGAVDAALQLSGKAGRESAIGIALKRLATADPQAALARATQIPDAEMRRRQLQSVLGEWAANDPAAAAAQASSLPAGRERNDALSAVIAGTARTDSAAAMRLVEQMPIGDARTRALRQVVNETSYNDPKVAAEFILAMPLSQQRNSMYQVAGSFARTDRPAALEWVAKLGSAEARTAAMQTIVRDWASEDPRGAAQFCVSNSGAKIDDLGNAVTNWAQTDAREALAWAGALSDASQREAAVASAISGLAASNPAEAAATAGRMLSGAKQAQEMGNIAGSWAASDPAAAAAWAARLSDPAARGNAESSIASSWAQQDPAAAATWASRLPNATNAMYSITREWAAQDPVAAANWLGKLPAGNSRDAAISTFSQTVVGADPEGAAAWAATISEPQQRNNSLGNVYRQWQRSEPKAAEAWLRTTTALSTEARAALSR